MTKSKHLPLRKGWNYVLGYYTDSGNVQRTKKTPRADVADTPVSVSGRTDVDTIKAFTIEFEFNG
jgi:hypothetical protein